MLSLVHMMRENTEKLERHEVRERQLGEQVKKAISLLSKRVSAIDGVKTHLTKLDERIGGIETLISQVWMFPAIYKFANISENTREIKNVKRHSDELGSILNNYNVTTTIDDYGRL